MTLIEVKLNLAKTFPDCDLQIDEYISGIEDYNNEDAYDNITTDELEDDFRLFLTFYKENLGT